MFQKLVIRLTRSVVRHSNEVYFCCTYMVKCNPHKIAYANEKKQPIVHMRQHYPHMWKVRGMNFMNFRRATCCRRRTTDSSAPWIYAQSEALMWPYSAWEKCCLCFEIRTKKIWFEQWIGQKSCGKDGLMLFKSNRVPRQPLFKIFMSKLLRLKRL